ncbi:MAG: RluA family pseudouridine synthase, partial [Pseudomonadota bacterium]
LSLVHRLDRETSGVLVLTKRRSELRRLHEAFREGRVSKVYQALVVGHWSLGTIDIDAPLAVNERRGGERHVVVSKAGKASLTKVMPTEMRKAGSLVTVHPQTGRTHQIRVHLQHRGHPIVGDSRYGDPDDNRRLKRLGAGRLCLHAQSIAFADEHGGERMFTAPLPEDFETAMDAVFRAS